MEIAMRLLKIKFLDENLKNRLYGQENPIAEPVDEDAPVPANSLGGYNLEPEEWPPVFAFPSKRSLKRRANRLANDMDNGEDLTEEEIEEAKTAIDPQRLNQQARENFPEELKIGEPMDIAWQLLKAALFAPKSGHRDEENYPTRAAKKPPAQPPAGPSRWSEKARSEWARYADKYDQEHFFNRVGVAGGGQRAANFRESLPGSAFYTEDEEGNPVTHSVQSNAMWPSDPGEEGVKDAGRRYWSGDKMRNLLIEPQRKPKHFGEGTRVESWDETMARQREANKLIEQMGLTQRIPQSEGGARQEMRPGWKFGAGGRKEETEVGDEAWDKIRLPEGMTHIQEGHEGSDDWWKDAKPIDWRGEGEA
tara:strand:- start:25 stop:1116 length:1092 start_codon:yes stop_codon:yes gene_type:complete